MFLLLSKLFNLIILAPYSITLISICQDFEVDERSVFGLTWRRISLRLNEVDKIDLDSLIWARAIDTTVLHGFVENLAVRASVDFPICLVVM